jgi:dUTP pyrophosphatase
MVNVKIRVEEGAKIPVYQTYGSAGMDVCAFLPNGVEKIGKGEIKLIKTGIYIELPDGYEAQIRPRSGLALKSGITVLNSPGTIDSDYRGEVGIILINHSENEFIVNSGDRICQMVIAKHEKVQWHESDKLETTNRNSGGFGHTGV